MSLRQVVHMAARWTGCPHFPPQEENNSFFPNSLRTSWFGGRAALKRTANRCIGEDPLEPNLASRDIVERQP
jgi:hypothetical protein